MNLGVNLTIGGISAIGSSVPANALRDRMGAPILDRSGGYILTR